MAKKTPKQMIEDALDGIKNIIDDKWQPGTVYLRHASGGSSYIEEHQCWHVPRFLAAQQSAVEAINDKLKAGEARASISVVTYREYFAARFGA